MKINKNSLEIQDLLSQLCLLSLKNAKSAPFECNNIFFFLNIDNYNCVQKEKN